MKMPDIDIDMADRKKLISKLPVVQGFQYVNDKISTHPSAVYFQNIPVSPLTGLSAIDYKEAEELGYFKIDFLNQSVYSEVRDEDHLNTLLETEPLWELLDDPFFVSNLPHIKNHFEVVDRIKPKCIDDMALVLALIRPAKRHLLYKSRREIEENIWIAEDNDQYFFKKSHSISYSYLIAIKMNLIVEQLNADIELDNMFN